MSYSNRNTKTQISKNQQYGLGASGFAVALFGTIFFCLALGTLLIGATGYHEEFRLSAHCTIGFGLITWLLVLFAPNEQKSEY